MYSVYFHTCVEGRGIHDDYMTVLNPGVIMLACETGTCLNEQVQR